MTGYITQVQLTMQYMENPILTLYYR